MESGAIGCEVCKGSFCPPLTVINELFFLALFSLHKSVLFVNYIQVIVSGKLRAQRAKAMKFKDGYMISSGQPVNEYIDSAVRHVLLRQVSFVTL